MKTCQHLYLSQVRSSKVSLVSSLLHKDPSNLTLLKEHFLTEEMCEQNSHLARDMQGLDQVLSSEVYFCSALI